jgi:2-keto-4-pentenoate hydratase/2-oxohepta-3-ene-1,7-dioic acid hydratase in catechol pathway
MTGYKLATYRAPEGPRAGMVLEDALYDVAAATGVATDASVLALLEDWPAASVRLSAAAAKPKGKALPLGTAELLAPVLYPSAIYCAGANYTDHMLEMANLHKIAPAPDPHQVGLKPWHFIKSSRTVVGPGVAVKLPAHSKAVDWEVELVAVIGRKATRVPFANALDYVAGYTIANDLSARDVMKRDPLPDSSPFKYDWVAQKCFDGACPLGPWIVPAIAIADPQKLDLKLWVNGTIKQDSNTSKMIFTLAEQLSQLSTYVTLYPGDLILTGTPSGVGAARHEFLKAGDSAKLWIEGIGTLENRMA